MNESSPAVDDDIDARVSLAEVARRVGTPAYAFDVRRARAQVEKLRRHLPAAVDVLYSLKANASLGVCEIFSACGVGADVASAGELVTAIEAGFPRDRIFVAGPFKLPDTVGLVRELPDAVLSVDSASELRMLADSGVRNRLVLRLRPDFDSAAVVTAGSESRFGFTADDLGCCRELVRSERVRVIGFHVFAGSQVLSAEQVNGHLRKSFELTRRAADTLGIEPALLNLGGGFGIPYRADEPELDLGAVGVELDAIAEAAGPARVVLELGRYLVAQCGWYLTRVIGSQNHRGRRAVVVDGGTHQRADLCGLCLRTKARPPVVLDGELCDSARVRAARNAAAPTDVLGCLSLPADVLAESALLPELDPGNVLAFGNAGAYGVWSSPALFHGSPLPAEAAFDGSTIHVMRERQPARSILDGQRHVRIAKLESVECKEGCTA
jgi:diaminopimelate decarboxylase